MNLERRTINLIALSFIALVYFPFALEHQMALNMTMGVFILIAFYREINPFIISKFISNFLIVAAIVFIFSIYGTLFDLIPALGLLSLLSILKFIELKSKRDYFIFILMVQLLLVGQLLSVDSLLFVIYLLVVTFLFFYLMLVIQRTDFSQGSFIILKSKEKEGVERRKVLVQCFLVSLPVSAILFFFFPRFVVGNIFSNNVQRESKTGFVNELNPGEYSKVAQDRTPIFRAQFFSENKPLAKDLYWRGTVLGTQNGFRWSKSPARKRIERHYGEKENYIYEIDFAEGENGHLFTLNNTENVSLYSHGKVFQEPGSTFRFISTNEQYLRYRAVTKDVTRYDLTEVDLQYYLVVPDDVPEDLRNFAKELKDKNRSTDWSLIQHLMAHYQKNDYIYTLSPGEYDNDTGMSEFFFNRKRGFCEHYSSTTATLLRLMGIPSRIVTGFQGGLYNNIGDYYIIRGEDAHAWVEAWVEKRGWVLVDPVRFIAPNRIELGAASLFASTNMTEGLEILNFLRGDQHGFIRSIIFTFDSIYYRLNQFFLSYDREAQQTFFNKLGFDNLKRNQIFFIGVAIVTFIGAVLFWYLAFKHQRRGRFFKVNKKITNYFLRRGIIIRPYEGYMSMIEKLDLVIDKDERQRLRDILFELNRLVYDPEYQKIKQQNDRFFVYKLMAKIPR